MKNKKIIAITFLIFLFMLVGYSLYTARNVILGPRLELSVPGGIMTATSQVIEITGSAINTTELRLNNRVIILTQDGGFSEKMLLSVGNNVFVFDAVDKFNRSAQKVLQVVYAPKTGDVLQLKEGDTNINNINNNHDSKEENSN